MKLRKLFASFTAAAVAAACMTSFAGATEENVKGGYFDDFESYTSNDIFTGSSIWSNVSGVGLTNSGIITVESESITTKTNKYISIAPASSSDTMLISKSVTGSKSIDINFKFKTDLATASPTAGQTKIYAYIGNTKYEVAKATYGQLRLANDNTAAKSYTVWNDISINVDTVNNKITTSFGNVSQEIAATASGTETKVAFAMQVLGANTGNKAYIEDFSIIGDGEGARIVDNFDSYTTNDIFTGSDVWSTKTNNGEIGIISEDIPERANHYLGIAPNNDASKNDTMLITKPVTGGETTKINFDFKTLKASGAWTGGQTFVYVTVGGKQYEVLRATYNGIRLVESTVATAAYNSWNNVNVIIDKKNHKMKTTLGNSAAYEQDISAEITKQSDVKVGIKVQGANNVNKTFIDNFMIADAFYYGDTFIANEDFDRFADGNAAMINPTLNGVTINDKSCTDIVYDENADNNYIVMTPTDAVKQPVVLTKGITTEKTALEFDLMLAPDTEQFSVYISRKDGFKNVILNYTKANGLKLLLKNDEVSGIDITKAPVHFKFSLTSMGTFSSFVNGTFFNYRGDYNANIINGDVRFQCNYELGSNPTASVAYLDNIKLYTPAAPQMRTVYGSDAVNVGYSDYIEVETNNPVNEGSFDSGAGFLINGSNALVESCDSDYSPYRIYVKGGLKPNTTYTLTTVDNKVKDFYDQFITVSESFSTANISASTAFTDGEGNPLEKTSAGTVKATTTISNSSSEWPGKVIAVLYGANGIKQIAVCEKEALVNNDVIVNTFDAEATDTVRIFVWNGLSDIVPICEKAELSAN